MRIVIKIGTSTLAHPTGHLNIRRVEQMCKIVSDIKNTGHELKLVTSSRPNRPPPLWVSVS